MDKGCALSRVDAHMRIPGRALGATKVHRSFDSAISSASGRSCSAQDDRWLVCDGSNSFTSKSKSPPCLAKDARQGWGARTQRQGLQKLYRGYFQRVAFDGSVDVDA